MRTLISNGDSWTYGSELHNPAIVASLDPRSPTHGHDCANIDHDPNNDSYRLAHAYPFLLANLFDAKSIDLSIPADNNNLIADRTIDYVIKNNLSGPDVFVIIGWTAPERTDFYMEVGTGAFRHRIYNVNHYENVIQSETWKHQGFKQYHYLHYDHLIVAEEYWTRYAKNVALVELVLKSRNIPYLMFNAFYPATHRAENQPWKDLDDCHITNQLLTLRQQAYQSYADLRRYDTHNLDVGLDLWQQVDPIRWYKKDQHKNTFRSFVNDRVTNAFFNDVGHPTEESHRVWALELCDYIKKNNLW